MLVRYVGEDEPRPEYHSLGPFVVKGTEFSFENEVRLLSVADVNETIYLNEERDLYRTLGVRPEELIVEVRTHPATSKKFRRQVANLCSKFTLPAPRRSTLEKSAL